jgi:hypothetical protein
MSLGRLENRLGAFVSAAAFTAVLAAAGDAGATGPVTPTGKGIVGGALLGGEVVVIPMGIAGVQRGWPYFVFGGLGMVGGAVGGYFVEKATAVNTANGVTTGGPAEPAIYMLAGGLALIIPALVVSLNATAYHPPESDRGEPANNEPSKEPPKPDAAPAPAPPGGAAPPPGSTSSATPPYQYKSRFRGELARMPHIPVSLLDMYAGKLSFGIPAVQVRPLYTQQEMWQYNVSQGTEVRIPAFKVMF